MFGNAKPAASLSSGLLARKGQARPAMRPQGFVGLDPGTSLDDLGWNDMGDDAPPPVPAPTHLTPPAPAPASAPVPPVVAQREALEQHYSPQPVAAAPEPDSAAPKPPVSNATAARIKREVTAKKGKAAFTLRLDNERHLKLRLASAVSGRSAQLLVTEALDAFLETLPEVGALVSQLPLGKAR
ncbi:hypothetical protein [Sphingomonas sp.]|uniref:hypothetical protein n=1 Tax=Sphingomonas sp. TaxID=28214 RepID=UPI001ED40A17|nr:hypothetical protein [Sphingomonas sp.]MBX3595196.1 hypothetical protein [Sphingomonas sp.]